MTKSLTLGQVAAIAGVTRKTVIRWTEEGKLSEPFRTLGGHRRYDEDTVRGELGR